MKKLLLAASFGLAVVSAGDAVAACAAPATRVQTLITLLRNNTACVPTVRVATMTWQELHQADGTLVDYKRGPSSPSDRSAPVGTWATTNSATPNATVTYSYTGGPSYTYTVWANANGTHSFCAPGKEVVARIKTGGGAC